MNPMMSLIGRKLASFLAQPQNQFRPCAAVDEEQMQNMLQPGDVILVEGNSRVSTAIKYLTQSTWSHSALYIGDALGKGNDFHSSPTLLEADFEKGVVAVPLSNYAHFNMRICRPINIRASDRDKVVQYAVDRLGIDYDLKNLLDLGRYLFPMPPVPTFMRRRMLAFGSGDPTRALCSTLIALAYQSVRFPILPHVEVLSDEQRESCSRSIDEIMHIRHHSLYSPRDFDLSPYFEVVKPAQVATFDYRNLVWYEDVADELDSQLDPCEQAQRAW